MPKYIEVTEDEAWAIDHTIRHTFSDGPTNIGRDLLLKVMNVILEFEERRGKPFSPQVLPLAVTEDECWALDHQIRCDLTVNGKPVGRALLLKAFQALTEFANERDSLSGVTQLGTLADLLRSGPEGGEAPEDRDAPNSGDAQPRQENPGGNPPDRPSPEDGAPGPRPRGK
ncbi:MAG TPA: hypothetical protein VHS99_20790 [Chloroflexota bacterium]|jgi:hypothetical protein|nr:hypothetical protein [Chloroflexota bacterium]